MTKIAINETPIEVQKEELNKNIDTLKVLRKITKRAEGDINELTEVTLKLDTIISQAKTQLDRLDGYPFYHNAVGKYYVYHELNGTDSYMHFTKYEDGKFYATRFCEEHNYWSNNFVVSMDSIVIVNGRYIGQYEEITEDAYNEAFNNLLDSYKSKL